MKKPSSLKGGKWGGLLIALAFGLKFGAAGRTIRLSNNFANISLLHWTKSQRLTCSPIYYSCSRNKFLLRCSTRRIGWLTDLNYVRLLSQYYKCKTSTATCLMFRARNSVRFWQPLTE